MASSCSTATRQVTALPASRARTTGEKAKPSAYLHGIASNDRKKAQRVQHGRGEAQAAIHDRIGQCGQPVHHGIGQVHGGFTNRKEATGEAREGFAGLPAVSAQMGA